MTSKTIKNMTAQEIIEAIEADTPLNRVRRVLSNHYGKMDQADRSRWPPQPIERRRMELEAANEICGLFGIRLP